MSLMNPRTEKLLRRLTIVTTVTASYFLVTADYGPQPNALDPIKKQILSAESSAKEYFFGSKKESQENHAVKFDSNNDRP